MRVRPFAAWYYAGPKYVRLSSLTGVRVRLESLTYFRTGVTFFRTEVISEVVAAPHRIGLWKILTNRFRLGLSFIESDA